MANIDNLLQAMKNHQEDFKTNYWEGSFEDFVSQKLEVDPIKYTRTAYQLVFDMVNYYGAEEFEDNGEFLTRYQLFSDPFNNGANEIFGLDRTLNRLMRYIRAASMEEGLERIFVLHGPVGTAKTSLIDLMARGMEHYSRLPEGEVFSFSWVLPQHLKDKGQLGFQVSESRQKDTDIFATVPSQLRDNPVYLIPKPYRQEYLAKMFGARYDGSYVIPYKIMEGSLDHNNSQIFNYLMREFEGDWRKVVSFVRVERFYYSEIEGAGLAKVFPEGNVETSSSTITFDENWRYLAQLLQSVNLIKFHGKYVAANRGILHYSDIFKKPIQYLQHLLSAIEEHIMDFGEIGADIDLLIIATTNLPEYEELRKNPVSKGLRSRMRKIDVPYLLSYQDEKRIYDQALRQITKRRHVSPHTTEVAGMWAVLTRLEKSKLHSTKQFDEDINTTLRKLTPYLKMKLYNGEFDGILSQQDRVNLTRQVRRTLRNEYWYEGMDGCPTRILQNVFADICETNEERCILPFDLYAGIQKVIDQGGVNYDFLNRKPTEGFHEFENFLEQVRDFHLEEVNREVETSILDINLEELDNKIRNYVLHVRAFNNNKTVKNPVTGKDEDPDESLMRYIEDTLEIPEEEKGEYRFKILARATEAARTGKELVYRQTYADLYDAVEKALYQEKHAKIKWSLIYSTLSKMREGQDLSAVDKRTLKQIKVLLDNMIQKFGYCEKCARDMTLFFIEKKGLG
ncbi:hypothetical protein ACFL54_00555 [Planctomycetota bacterium]